MQPSARILHPIPFLFARHGESTWNVERRVQGQTDVPLSKAGIAQAVRRQRELIEQAGRERGFGS